MDRSTTLSAPMAPAERVIGLLAALATPAGDGTPAKRALLQAVADLIDADVWIWALTRTPTPGAPATDAQRLPAVVLRLDGGLNDAQRDHVLEIQRSPHRRVMAAVLMPEVQTTGRATHRRIDLFPDPAWHASPYRSECILPLGLDEFVLAVRRVGPADVSTAVFYRKTGRPGFDEDARTMLTLVADHVPWLHRIGDIDAAAGATVDLTPRERQVLQCLIAGLSRKQTAAKLGISGHTVSDHQKSIYRRFGVNSKGELQAKFMSGQAGPAGNGEGPR